MPKELFAEFVEVFFDNSQAAAAEALGVDRSLVSRMLAGDRRFSPTIAKRIEDLSGGRYQKEKFVWPENDQAA